MQPQGPAGDSAGRKGCDEKDRPRESGACSTLHLRGTQRPPGTGRTTDTAWELVAAEREDHGSPKGPGTQVTGLGWGAGCPRQAGLGEFIRTETTSILKVSSVLN